MGREAEGDRETGFPDGPPNISYGPETEDQDQLVCAEGCSHGGQEKKNKVGEWRQYDLKIYVQKLRGKVYVEGGSPPEDKTMPCVEFSLRAITLVNSPGSNLRDSPHFYVGFPVIPGKVTPASCPEVKSSLPSLSHFTTYIYLLVLFAQRQLLRKACDPSWSNKLILSLWLGES